MWAPLEVWQIYRRHTSSVLLTWGNLSCTWSCEWTQLQELGERKSTCHAWSGQSQWGLMHDAATGRCFISELTVPTATYVDMQEPYESPQWPPGTVFQQDAALPHYSHIARNHLHHTMPGGWIGLRSANSLASLVTGLKPNGFLPMGLYKEPSPAGQKLRSSAAERPHNWRCGYGTHKSSFKTRGQRSNTVWIFAVPTGLPTLESTRTRITQETSYFLKAQIARLYNE